MKNYLPVLIALIFIYSCTNEKPQDQQSIETEVFTEPHRPQFHFSPDSMWMNDPNGLVYHQSTYHMFYQYYPDSTVWGPMHWGHATSTDLVSWEDEPVALYPDELGYIFSGSAVVDKNNTSGLGTSENPPLIAIFTYHDPVAAEENPEMSQSQGIAYSLDNGDSWTKYENNPVLKSPGIRDFRDPNVMWYEPTQRWIMTLAVQDHIRFYSSPDLKSWQLESEFGRNAGAHGGVWECPDLFPLKSDSEMERWILIVSINPGGPNGGSGTQYFVGDFDGSHFVPVDDNIRWLDYGPDNYAGITWSNVRPRRIFLGWMSNWKYAQVVPTDLWRSAMTIPRELELETVNDYYIVSSMPVPEFHDMDRKAYEIPEFQVDGTFDLSEEIGFVNPTFEMDLEFIPYGDLEIIFSNNVGNQLIVMYGNSENKFFIDRSKTGNTEFHPEFANIAEGPRYSWEEVRKLREPEISREEVVKLKLVLDVASVELFADEGTTVMTSIFFPDQVLDHISFRSEEPVSIRNLVISDIL
jgi:fructan beta-fructosidase